MTAYLEIAFTDPARPEIEYLPVEPRYAPAESPWAVDLLAAWHRYQAGGNAWILTNRKEPEDST